MRLLWCVLGVSMRSSSQRIEVDSHCVPKLTKSFFQATLDAARQRLGLKPGKPDGEGILSNLNMHSWGSFWRYTPGECAVAGMAGRCVVFVPTVNVETTTIRNALFDGMERLAWTVERDYVTISQVACSAETLYRPPDLDELCWENTYVFTVVMEPLLHFVAGYQKYVELQYGDASAAQARRRVVLGGDDPQGLVEALVSGTIHLPKPNTENMALMSGAFRNRYGSLDYVARLDKIQEDWSVIMEETKLTSPDLVGRFSPPQVGERDDPLGARRDMVALLERNATLRTALCHLLEPDYSCFSFDIQKCLDGTALLAS